MATKKIKIGYTPKGDFDSNKVGGYDILDTVYDSGTNSYYVSKVSGNTAALSDTTKWEKQLDGSRIESKIAEMNALINEMKETYGGSIEGYIRVSGVSDPKLSYRHYEVTGNSVFDLFKPCLVERGTGKISKVLQVLDWTKDEKGNDAAIDGSEGEVLICNVEGYYHISDKVDYEGTTYDVFLRSRIPFVWAGVAAEYQAPFGWAPGYCVAHKDDDGVTRMHSVYNTEWDGSYQDPKVVGAYIYSTDGDGNIVETYDANTPVLHEGAKGLCSTNYRLDEGEQLAMNLNEDTTKPVPFYNATARGAEMFLANMVAESGTFDLHNESLGGSGSCCNDSYPDDAQFLASGTKAISGLRYMNSKGAWRYQKYWSRDKVTVFSGQWPFIVVNDWRPHWKCMEQQRVLMYVHANDIAEQTWFVFEGNKYKWRSIPGMKSLADGVMNGVVWKYLKSKMPSGATDPMNSGADISGNDVEWMDCSCVIRGIITDVSPSWWTSGLAFVVDYDGNYTAYYEKDQSKLAKTPYYERTPDDTPFNIESWPKVAEYGNGTGYAKDYLKGYLLLPDTTPSITSGASNHSYICRYNWLTSRASKNRLAVRAFRRGSTATGDSLSPLAISGYFSAVSSASHFAFGICCQIVKD